jgi:two-component system CheB/CheR fusion protein
MTDRTDRGLERVHRHLADLGAHSLTLFKGPYFDRRLRSRLRVRGVADAEAYADVLDREPDERRRLVSALAIGVTGFFRNPTAWIRLGHLIEPSRRAATALDQPPAFRALSAGCATGEEAWSLALLLADRAEAGVISDWQVDGTDLDERSLVVARGGEYSDRVISDIRPVLDPVPGVVADGQFSVSPSVRSKVRFRRVDLTKPVGSDEYDLVVCRNVLIYFATEAQQRVMESILTVLRIGGLLMLGQAELAAFQLLPRLEIVDRRERIYRRMA